MSEYFEVKKNPELIERSVIEQIRAEIKQKRDDMPDYYYQGLNEALEVIDKYMEGV